MIRVALTAAPDASGHYRIRQPAAEVARQWPNDFQVQIGNLRELEIGSFDLLVLQRPMYWFMPAVIEQVRKLGVPVIIELDDDMHSTHPDSPGRTMNNPRTNPEQNWNHLSACLRQCDHVTVSTDHLAKRYGSAASVSVLRNAVDDWWTDPLTNLKPLARNSVVGWTGSTKFHKGDPNVTRGAINDVLLEHRNWAFHVIGASKERDDTAKAFGLDRSLTDRYWTNSYVERELLPYVMRFGLGIVPLADTAFNRSKSWLKGIEYAALGIPFVASNLPEYQLLQQSAIGHCVENKARRWRAALKMYMEDDQFRLDSGSHNHAMVRDRFTISKRALLWAETWDEVYKRGVSNGTR